MIFQRLWSYDLMYRAIQICLSLLLLIIFIATLQSSLLVTDFLWKAAVIRRRYRQDPTAVYFWLMSVWSSKTVDIYPMCRNRAWRKWTAFADRVQSKRLTNERCAKHLTVTVRDELLCSHAYAVQACIGGHRKSETSWTSPSHRRFAATSFNVVFNSTQIFHSFALIHSLYRHYMYIYFFSFFVFCHLM